MIDLSRGRIPPRFQHTHRILYQHSRARWHRSHRERRVMMRTPRSTPAPDLQQPTPPSISMSPSLSSSSSSSISRTAPSLGRLSPKPRKSGGRRRPIVVPCSPASLSPRRKSTISSPQRQSKVSGAFCIDDSVEAELLQVVQTRMTRAAASLVVLAAKRTELLQTGTVSPSLTDSSLIDSSLHSDTLDTVQTLDSCSSIMLVKDPCPPILPVTPPSSPCPSKQVSTPALLPVVESPSGVNSSRQACSRLSATTRPQVEDDPFKDKSYGRTSTIHPYFSTLMEASLNACLPRIRQSIDSGSRMVQPVPWTGVSATMKRSSALPDHSAPLDGTQNHVPVTVPPEDLSNPESEYHPLRPRAKGLRAATYLDEVIFRALPAEPRGPVQVLETIGHKPMPRLTVSDGLVSLVSPLSPVFEDFISDSRPPPHIASKSMDPPALENATRSPHGSQGILRKSSRFSKRTASRVSLTLTKADALREPVLQEISDQTTFSRGLPRRSLVDKTRPLASSRDLLDSRSRKENRAPVLPPPPPPPRRIFSVPRKPSPSVAESPTPRLSRHVPDNRPYLPGSSLHLRRLAGGHTGHTSASSSHHLPLLRPNPPLPPRRKKVPSISTIGPGPHTGNSRIFNSLSPRQMDESTLVSVPMSNLPLPQVERLSDSKTAAIFPSIIGQAVNSTQPACAERISCERVGVARGFARLGAVLAGSWRRTNG
ncbi:hypothetical protein OF83DRAFT_1098362 [Amylostereum chailletii]|nr:hypothetical protein OF83DRAFT_1098362 [Amylostereum chailletii]